MIRENGHAMDAFIICIEGGRGWGEIVSYRKRNLYIPFVERDTPSDIKMVIGICHQRLDT